GADIHEIDNSASRTGRLLDEVAGDAEAVAARRDEIIEALNGTAEPYFGDLDSMTYLQWLERYLALAVGTACAADFDCGSDLGDVLADAHTSPWLDVSWRERFREMLQRAEARLHPVYRGPIPTLFADDAVLERPYAALKALAAQYPDAGDVVLHPADVPFFVSLCKTPGKPVNFVPVVDQDVRRWWRSDSLWQAHDPRYSADQVCVIPGTVAVAGITRVDEPVGELLDRFEKATADELVAEGAEPVKLAARRHRDIAPGLLDAVLSSPDVSWAGRQTRNPIHRLGDLDEWTVESETAASHAPTGATLPILDDEHVGLRVPLVRDKAVEIRLTVPASVVSGGAPVVTEADADASMSALLGVAAGQELPEVKKGAARITLGWLPEKIADHA